MRKSILYYGAAVAGGGLVLQWLEYRYLVRAFPAEAYIALVAVLFASFGIWIGHRLSSPRTSVAFERNDEAIDYLGISARELEVLQLLARGYTNQEIARELFVSPNTIKTHLSRVYGKLAVSRRTQAVQKARSLRMIP